MEIYKAVQQVVKRHPWSYGPGKLEEEVEEMLTALDAINDSPRSNNAVYDNFQLECADVLNIAAFIDDYDTFKVVETFLRAGSYNLGGIRGLCMTKMQLVEFRHRLQSSGITTFEIEVPSNVK